MIFTYYPNDFRLFDPYNVILAFATNIPVLLKGIVHFEIKIWYLSAYPKGIQDVGVFFFFSRSNFDFFRSNRSSLSVI